MMFMEGVGIGGCRVCFLINFAAVFIFCRMRAAVTLVFRYRRVMKFSMEGVFSPKLFTCIKGYERRQLPADVMAGVITGIVAIPLAIAFGIASGVGPTEGLVTAIIAGFIISALGCSKVQIGGPTGAFIVIVYGIIQQFGTGGLMIATLMAGIMLVVMGMARMGSVIKFVPYPVIVGFTGGIAVTIFSTQMNDFFGLGIENVPADFVDKWICYFGHWSEASLPAIAVGAVSLIIIIIAPKIAPKVPGSLLAIVTVTLGVWLLERFAGLEGIETIGDRYALPTGLPAPHVPEVRMEEGQNLWDVVRMLFPAAFTIAMLGAIESLLSAMVADGVTGDRHNSNTELIGQGLANMVVPFFGGIPATGAIARTMTNINNGGRTPVAGIVHSAVLLLVLLALGPLVGYIPMPCLAAVLIMVAYNMSGWRSFIAISKNPKSDFIVLMVTFVLTVVFDLTVAIEVGLLLAVVLFLKRTSEAVQVRQFKNEIDPNAEVDINLHEERLKIAKGIEVYEIDGPYFFGIANKFDEIMNQVGDRPKVRVIRMRKVPFMDSTGIHNLQTLCEKAKKEGIEIVLSGVNPDVRTSLEKAGFREMVGEENICPNINVALVRAEKLL